MSVDYQINLVKQLTSSTQARGRFHTGMIAYLIACAVALITSAYFAGTNILHYTQNQAELKKLITTAAAVSDMDASDFKDPDVAYSQLMAYSGEIGSIRNVLQKRKMFLPIIQNLFNDLPKDVELINLTAEKDRIIFSMNTPVASSSTGDPVGNLKRNWESNQGLMRRVVSIRTVKGQRRMIGSESVFNVHFECILRK